jgi:hypothetical protein
VNVAAKALDLLHAEHAKQHARVLDAVVPALRECVVSQRKKLMGENNDGVDPDIFIQAVFEALIAEAGFAVSDSIGHGVETQVIVSSTRRAMAAGIEAGVQHHERHCGNPDCGFRENVEDFLLEVQPPSGEA